MAAAVRLDISDGSGIDPGRGVSAFEGRLARGEVRRDGIEAGSARGADALDDGVNRVAVAHRVVQTLEDDSGRTFAGQRAIGIGVEGTDAAPDREGAMLMAGQHGAHIAGQIDGADDGLLDFASLQRADSGLEGVQTGTLLAADGEARSAQVKLAGDPAGDDAAERSHRPAGGQRRAGGVAQLRLERPAEMEVRRVQVETDANEDAGTWPAFLGESGRVEGLGGDLQHEQLLRQRLLQFARRDAKAIGLDRDFRSNVVAGEGAGTRIPVRGTSRCPARPTSAAAAMVTPHCHRRERGAERRAAISRDRSGRPCRRRRWSARRAGSRQRSEWDLLGR